MLSNFIKQQRKKLNLTQEQISEILNISRPTYNQIEQGQRDLTLSEADKLTSLFNISFEDFKNCKDKKPEINTPNKKHKQSKKSEIRISVPQKNLIKFKEALLYILSKVGAKPNIGEAVIYKILYFIDFDYFEKFEEQIIGATYIKNHFGPTPIEFKKIADKMIEEKELLKLSEKYFKFTQKKYLPLRNPDLSLFSAREMNHINDVLSRLSDKNAKEMEIYSHEDIPWKTTEYGKAIPYESVFYRDEHYSVRNYEDEL